MSEGLKMQLLAMDNMTDKDLKQSDINESKNLKKQNKPKNKIGC